MRFKDLTGQTFNRLLIKEPVGAKPGGFMWRCICVCGKIVEVRTAHLLHGHQKSCGCLKDENTKKRATIHGASAGGKLTGTYVSWKRMRERCHNPKAQNYAWYGAKGVIVCNRWRNSFVRFLADMGERPTGHTIERRDVFGDYEPKNCYWLHKSQQWKNKRKPQSIDTQ